MTADYIPRPGDRVRYPNWPAPMYVDVTAVGDTIFIGKGPRGDEKPWMLGPDEWDFVSKPTPLPEQWINVYPTYVIGHPDRASAEHGASPERIAVLHVCPDSTVEVIRTDGGGT